MGNSANFFSSPSVYSTGHRRKDRCKWRKSARRCSPTTSPESRPKREALLTDYFTREQARFYRLAYSYLKNREEALDAVQTAVCRAWERQDSLRDPSALHTWFCRILVNACTDLLRQRGRVTYVPLEDLEEGGYEDPLPADDSLAARVDALPPEVAAVIRLRFYEELSLKEISAVTGAPLSTVKTRLYTGLKKLRVSLEGVYDL